MTLGTIFRYLGRIFVIPAAKGASALIGMSRVLPLFLGDFLGVARRTASDQEQA
jgi:hypothetical protein